MQMQTILFTSTRIDDDCVYTGKSQHRCQPKVNYRHKEKEVLDQILGPGSYDARIRPSGVNGTGNTCDRQFNCYSPRKTRVTRSPDLSNIQTTLMLIYYSFFYYNLLNPTRSI